MTRSPDMRNSVSMEGQRREPPRCKRSDFTTDGTGRDQSGILFGGAEVPGHGVTATAQRAKIVGAAGIVGVTDEIGDRRVAQHAATVGQHRATEAQYLSVGEID